MIFPIRTQVLPTLPTKGLRAFNQFSTITTYYHALLLRVPE